MEPILDRCYLLTQEMAEETIERIQADRVRVSVRLQPLLDYILEFLFDSDLNVDSLRRWTETHDRNVSTHFARELGAPPWTYITDRRFEIAARVLAASDFKVWRIGTNVGYDHPSSFSRAFKQWCGKSPTEYRREAQAAAGETAPVAGKEAVAVLAAGLESLDHKIARGLSGEAEPGEALATLRELQDAQAGIYLNYWDLEPPSPEEESAEQAVARGVWQSIEGLTPAEQRAAVESQSGFRTPAFFHQLCARSYEIGAEDPERGLQIARLAPLALEGLVGQLDQGMLRSFEARAQVVAAQALRRCGDSAAAAEAFDAAERALEDAGDDALLPVIAELNHMKFFFLMAEGEYEEAGRPLQAARDAAREIFERLRDDPL